MIKNYIKYILYNFSFSERAQRIVESFDSMRKIKTIIIENGNSHEIGFDDLDKIENITVKLRGVLDKTNQLIIELPQSKKLRLKLGFKGQNNTVKFGADCFGVWNIALYQHDNKCCIGRGTECSGPTWISLINNELQIGDKCMFSDNIYIWGDGHSILSWPDKKVLNVPVEPIKIGDHCWVGEKTIITKNAQIPNDCIVGIASVLTKKFEEEHAVLAGVPARVVKHNVTWDGLPPVEYKKQNPD